MTFGIAVFCIDEVCKGIHCLSDDVFLVALVLLIACFSYPVKDICNDRCAPDDEQHHYHPEGNVVRDRLILAACERILVQLHHAVGDDDSAEGDVLSCGDRVYLIACGEDELAVLVFIHTVPVAVDMQLVLIGNVYLYLPVDDVIVGIVSYRGIVLGAVAFGICALVVDPVF